MSDTVEKAVMRAYGDSNHYGFDARNLNFRAPASVPPDVAAAIMREALADTTSQHYNAFYADLLESLPAHCRVTLAREGSVCIYVEGDFAAREWATNNFADEVSCQEDGTVRIWWD